MYSEIMLVRSNRNEKTSRLIFNLCFLNRILCLVLDGNQLKEHLCHPFPYLVRTVPFGLSQMGCRQLQVQQSQVDSREIEQDSLVSVFDRTFPNHVLRNICSHGHSIDLLFSGNEARF